MGVQSKLRTLKALFSKWKILRGDQVMITQGKDKGQTGKVLEVYRKKNRVLVEGLNLAKKHIKRTPDQPGGIITKEMPVHVSGVMVLDPATGKPTKIGYQFLEDGTKVRVSRGYHASGSIIPRDPILKERRKPLPTTEIGLKNTTTLNMVWEVTDGPEQKSALLGEALKSLILDESRRPRRDFPKARVPGFNCLPDSIDANMAQELLEMRGMLRVPRTWWNDLAIPPPETHLPPPQNTTASIVA
mmetsp:Transcript_49966/g.95449  ORF Transcript_49966/g.95449 Transcript_49966/m.95449 type:complete len:244 (-) Transcript_49966:223-954(-)|eukprot:CAMPEP_0114248046 /NCGR_PEP_ID=MMETSP0058-20121206/13353_1 /TAXON_ID=36894 /ORGANISM="Pyramimonas parkeae, CCMP726" /LENGTH=243 /DNA_ID=CAMNT_0001361405 /DNA_START=173 /DNA_END=904 /DNA_ORIENTATION=-